MNSAAGGPPQRSPAVFACSAVLVRQTGREPTTASDTAPNRPVTKAKLLQRIFAGGAALIVRSQS